MRKTQKNQQHAAAAKAQSVPGTARLKRALLWLTIGFGVAGAMALNAGGARAQDSSGLSLSANAAITSDYRFRGISLSDKDFAIQGGFDAEHESGFYLGTWGSSIESYAGSEFELDIYGGYASEIGGLSTDIGLLAYTYPGSSGTYYLEVYGSVGGEMGPASWTLGGAYVWAQENTGDADNIYLYLDGEMPLGNSPFSLMGHLAYEDGAFGSNKWDWNAGVGYNFEQFTLSLQYVDTNVDTREGKGGVVAMLSASF
ncbi:TorF family putative porin [Kordiimonas sp.]|uniref:TorF family putative porin n=1 Tax=Kordiimonas sp. TaxID=1970157 RepID=UPI003B521389